MIESIYINGLKSLKDLTLELKPGLNVLVGPNGSGKSNILLAVNLISKINQLEFINSVGSIGTTEIVKLFDILDTKRSINIVVKGTVELLTDSEPEDKNILNYEYDFVLGYDIESKYKLYFKKQILKLNNNNNSNFQCIYDNGKFYIEKNDKKFFSDRTLNIIDYFFNSNILKYRSIVDELSNIDNISYLVIEQLKSGELYNINPDIVRSNFDIPSSPEISYDGDGLSTVLLDICESKNESEDLTVLNNGSEPNYKELYSTIISYLQEFLPDVTELNMEYDEIKEKILGIAKFEKSNGKEIELPIDLLSDGSLKWLSLVTALLTSKGMFVLEEPENYLNPKMQQHITELMQETIDNGCDCRLFSTHSETILNLLSPEEVILTFYKNGRTYVKKIENPIELQEAIDNTGFGIGWMYVAGALD